MIEMMADSYDKDQNLSSEIHLSQSEGNLI